MSINTLFRKIRDSVKLIYAETARRILETVHVRDNGTNSTESARTKEKRGEPIIKEAVSLSKLIRGLLPYISILMLSLVGAWHGSTIMFVIGIADVLVFALWHYPTYTSIPFTQVGMVSLFGRRTGEILKEGLHELKYPYIYLVVLLSEKVFDNPIKVTVICKDRLPVETAGDLQYRMGARVGDAQGRNRFAEMDGSVITRGIDAAVEQELGFIAEQNDSAAFITSKETIALLIKCVLLLKVIPHKDKKFLERADVWKPRGYDANRGILAKHRLEFYEKNRMTVEALLEKETETIETSEIEQRYGLDIIAFALNRVDFDAETKKAQAANQQMEFYKEAIDPSQSTDPVGTQMALLGKATQHNVNVMGLVPAAQAFGAAIGEAMRKPGNQQEEKKGGSES
jgi:hypothetical protein